MQTDFDLVDAVSLDLLHSEPHTVSRYRIPLIQEVALQFEHQTGQCFGTPLDIGESICRRAAVVRQSAVVAGPLVCQGDALQIFGAAEPRSAPGFTDRAFRSGRRPDDGSYLRGIRIGNRTSEGGGASCSLYLGVIMLAGVIRFGTFGVSVVL